MHSGDIPETIGHYRIVSLLGEDAHGVIYQAVAQDTEQTVALKVLPAEAFPSSEVRQQFLAEARAQAQVTHPHLRQVYEAGETDTGIYLAMEYLQGSTLKNLLVAGSVELVAALEWSAEICEALAALHAKGLAHGYLRPEKIFITQESHAKLLDAGLWRLKVPVGVDLSDEKNLRTSGLEPAVVAGLAPEQLRGEAPTPRSDLYGLGVVLYEMLTGRNPFADRRAAQSMHWVLGRTPPPPSRLRPGIPAELDQVVARALSREPAGRFSSANKFAAALRSVVVEEELAPLVTEPSLWKLAAPLWLAIGGAILVLLLWYLYLALTHP